jgi:hypothetical protein
MRPTTTPNCDVVLMYLDSPASSWKLTVFSVSVEVAAKHEPAGRST